MYTQLSKESVKTNFVVADCSCAMKPFVADETLAELSLLPPSLVLYAFSFIEVPPSVDIHASFRFEPIQMLSLCISRL